MNKNNPHSAWFTTYGQVMQGQARIFAFPYSGAGASAYHQWAEGFRNSNINFIGIQLPGRENRLKEPPISHLPQLMQNLLSAITPLTDKPFVFFGHSLGALIAFELCQALRKQNLPLPLHLFVSAFRAPKACNPNKALHQLSEQEFITGIREYGNTSEDVLLNKELMNLFIPMLRADFCLHETYQYQEEAPLPCPITVLRGNKDHFAKAEHMSNWRQQTKAGFQEIDYAGNHFFLHEHRSAISQELSRALSY